MAYIYIYMVIVSTDSIYIMLLELSVVTNTQHHFLAARNHKEDHYDKYDSLLLDLQHAGFLVDLVTIEVGCAILALAGPVFS